MFSFVFIDQIQNIRLDIQKDQEHVIEQNIDINGLQETLKHLLQYEVKIIIFRLPSEYCILNPMPT